MLDEIKKFGDTLDLTKRFPKYFKTHTKIFVYFFCLCSLLLIFTSIRLDGFGGFYVECPCDALTDCENPFYAPFCYEDYCKDLYIPPCMSYGKMPSTFTQNVGGYIFLLFVYFAVANHIVYLVWGKHKK